MYMKTFLIMLQNSLKKDHPEVAVEMYVSRRSKFVHMDMKIFGIKKRRTASLNL